MEPTGIELVTSCLQSDTADAPEGPDSLGFAGDSDDRVARGYGWIRRD
jgi:hypothetical protein